MSAFEAHLSVRKCLQDPTLTIRELRSAFENGPEHESNLRESYSMAAAQWILIYGHELFQWVLSPHEHEFAARWKEGVQYQAPIENALKSLFKDKPKKLTLHRWHFWRDGFMSLASEKGSDLSQDCRDLCNEAAEKMEEIEVIEKKAG